jgi:hypothetical protein
MTMSFEIKYDAEGIPVKQPEPQFKEEATDQPMTAAPEEQEPEQQELQEETAPEPIQQYQKPAPQESWKALREKAERAERRAEELESIILESRSKKQPEVEEDLDINVDDDSLVEGKHLSKVNKKIHALQQQLKQYEQQSTVSNTEIKLKTQYPDFDSIVSVDNLNSLRSMYPEIAHTIDSSDDLYSKAITAYTIIKKLGISPQNDPFKNEKETAHRNAAKPKSLASISPQQGDSPLSKANAFANGTLTEELKKQMAKEMNEYRKNY